MRENLVKVGNGEADRRDEFNVEVEEMERKAAPPFVQVVNEASLVFYVTTHIRPNKRDICHGRLN